MYIVANGFSFTTKRGVLQSGDEVTEKDFPSHEAFVKRVSAGKIIVGKPKAQIEKEAAALAENQKTAARQAAAEKKSIAEKAAREKKETAEAAVKAAKDALAKIEGNLKDVETAIVEIEASRTRARNALGVAISQDPDISAARKALEDAEAELVKAKKPEQKTAAEGNVSMARAALAQKENADEGFKAAAFALAAAEDIAETTQTEKVEIEAAKLKAAEAVMLAESELEKAATALAAVEGK